jgi:hypothetical protein
MGCRHRHLHQQTNDQDLMVLEIQEFHKKMEFHYHH